MNPKKHHFLPECYLKPFTGLQKRLWRKFNDHSKLYPVTPAKVGYEFDANKIRTANAILFNSLIDENFIEREAFKKQENNYGKTVEEVIRFSISPLIIEKSKYSLFLETLITIKRRNPVSRQLLINAFKNAINDPGYLPQLRSSLVGEIGEENLPKGIDEYLKTYLYSEAKNNDRLYDMYLSAYVNHEYATIRSLSSDSTPLSNIYCMLL